MNPTSIQVIIPTLNEEEALRTMLPRIHGFWDPVDVLVVDGGSTDKTRQVTDEWKVRFLESPRRGRAAQMNYGAAASSHDVLLFLHADTRLPELAREGIRRAIADGCLGGAFARRFDSPSLWLRWTCRVADWRGRRLGWFYGDQAIFVCRDYFEQAGGFPEWPVFEDLEFSRGMARAGRTRLLRPPAITSARRFAARGAVRQSLLDIWATLCYLARGRPPVESLPQPSADECESTTRDDVQ